MIRHGRLSYADLDASARFFCIFSSFQNPPPADTAKPLSPTETNIAAYIDEHREDALALLEQAVNINSGTLTFEGVRKVGDLFAAEFQKLGFETRWIPMDAAHRSGHLFAERKGSAGKRVLLIGHLDTVFEKDSPFQRFERISPTLARGPGAVDMKGGNIAILYALKALSAAGALDGTQIVVAPIASPWPGEVALLGPCVYRPNPAILVGGSMAEAKPGGGHASGKPNIIPQTAMVIGDLRTLTLEQLAGTQDRMRLIVGQSLPQSSAQIQFENGYPPMPPTEGNMALLGVIQGVSRDLGFGPVDVIDPGKRGAADIS